MRERSTTCSTRSPSAAASDSTRAAAGRGFTGGWNATEIGTGTARHDVFLKELFVAASPVAGVDLETGGLYLARGENTEATSYDNDGYIVGERVTIRRPVARLVDEVSATRGYIGDFAQTNVFRRLPRLDRANYYQALARLRLAGRASTSIDYTWEGGTSVVRGAVTFDARGLGTIDRIRFENYARVDPLPSCGHVVTLQRRLSKRTMVAGGFSDIDRRYSSLSSDLTGTGRRVLGSIGVRIGKAWLGAVQVARAVDGSTPGPRTRLDLALGYDALRAWSSARSER